MDSSTQRPKWLTDEKIAEMRAWIDNCPNPYTDQEIAELELDAPFDLERMRANTAIRVLTKYGVLEA